MATSNKKKIHSRACGTGHGQLTLVEHALCPLDPSTSLAENLVHTANYHYTDSSRHLQIAQARVFCPLGLSPNDEFFLWGLLSITLSQPQSESEFYATPHYCLRQLGLIDQHARRGGRQYQQFSDSLTRLAAVVYQNDRFYDPVRTEHRKVSFGFLSYSLPMEADSSRAWRISWNPMFFEMVQAAAGGFRFDLATYRSLEPASRRLFLLLSKIFQRRTTSPRFDLHNLAVDVLGFSPTISSSDLKKKVRKCVERLSGLGVVAGSSSVDIFEKERAGRYRVTLQRGPYFDRKASFARMDIADSALSESLALLGLEAAAARRIIQQHPARLLQEWADITLAAKERFGQSFFKKSAAAYFINNVQCSTTSGRTPPDWWLELRKSERQRQAAEDRRLRSPRPEVAPETALSEETRETYIKVVGELFQQFEAAGQTPEIAKANARRFAVEHIRRLVEKKKTGDALVTSLKALLPTDPSL